MKKSENFIENRIRWKTKGYDLPTARTTFWNEGENILDFPQIPEVGNPVLISTIDEGNYIIVCTLGIINKHNNYLCSAKYNNIKSITDKIMELGEKKADLSRLVIKLKTGEEITVTPEPGKPAFAIWNILKMLVNLS